MHTDHEPYAKFTSKARIEKSLNSLLGLVEGMVIDGAINESEVSFLNLWLKEHSGVRLLHPYSELFPVVQAAIADGVITQDEREDIVWLCEKLRSTQFFDKTTADLQRLHAILGGIASDRRVTEEELRGLSGWLEQHEHLRRCWPYDEVNSLILGVLKDRKIDEQEQAMLRSFFSEFVAVLDDRTINSPVIAESTPQTQEESFNIVGLCAVCPDIAIEGSTFCFTGASSRYSRVTLADTVQKLGGQFAPSLTKTVDYLVIGADGNPCWAYACYGRKVEKAVELRKAGLRILIVHENDFHDAVADAS